jgi:N6-L-threonylcarbamoyladenine synthase
MIALAGALLDESGLGHGPELEAVPRGRDVPWDFLPIEPNGEEFRA